LDTKIGETIHGENHLDRKTGEGDFLDDAVKDVAAFVRDELGVFVVPSDPIYFAIELGKKSALETIEAIHSDPSVTVNRQALGEFFKTELACQTDDLRIQRYLLKAAHGGFETKYLQTVEETVLLN
jgi:hypothetical protein